MIDEAIVRFLEGHDSSKLDRLAPDLLGRQRAARIIHTGSDRRASEASWWTDFVPIRSTTLTTSSKPPAARELVAAVARAQWLATRCADRGPVLLLVPSDPDSSTDFALAVERSTPPEMLTLGASRNRFDALTARSWLAARQRGGQVASIVASDDMMTRLLGDLERRRLRFRLPAGSRIITLCAVAEVPAGGPSQTKAITSRLGVGTSETLYLVDQPTLSSRIPVTCSRDGNLYLADPPRWMKYRIVGDDDRQDEVEEGYLAVFDLATTRLPSYQMLEWRVAVDGTEIRLQPPS